MAAKKTTVNKGPHPTIDLKKCTGCGNCVNTCPAELFEIVNSKAKIKKGECLGCKACEYQCPKQAITVN